MVQRQAEAAADVGLDRCCSSQNAATGWPASAAASSAGVPCSSVAQMNEHLLAALALEARMDVGRQQAAGEIAEVLDAVDVGQGAGDQMAGCHGPLLGSSLREDGCSTPAPDTKTPPAGRQEGLGSGVRTALR